MSLAKVEHVDREAVLRTLNLNPQDPHTQALLLICDRYRLDPLLKHVVLIQGRPYITRDGYLSVAHESGQFDGIEVVEEDETDTHWRAKVSVFRKDMGRPFTYRGRYPKRGGNKEYGPEMAVKCAEVMSLRRAFNVTGVGAADERWDADSHERIAPDVAADLAERLNALGPDARTAFFEYFGNRRPQDLSAEEELVAEAFTFDLETAANGGVIDVAADAESAATEGAGSAPQDPAPEPSGAYTQMKSQAEHIAEEAPEVTP